MQDQNTSTRSIGNSAEELACKFLADKGYKILNRNYFIRGGELDIVASFDGVLVFVEVKARYSHQFGLPVEAITPWKLKALKKTANWYIHQNHLHNKSARFDLVGIDFTNGKPEIEHIVNIID